MNRRDETRHQHDYRAQRRHFSFQSVHCLASFAFSCIFLFCKTLYVFRVKTARGYYFTILFKYAKNASFKSSRFNAYSTVASR